ncbi:TonB-dependent receptor [Brevundimonas diminuta]|uniref:TonB-dependent receptor n=1 Tax=Brevundimonas diminuta TaxID=293 RepID=UPI0018DF9ACE|nr:TonB-dependent receptor [Brevundimonas diminuta]
MKKSNLFGAVCTVALAVAANAQAQSEPAPDIATVEEIVVTARHRAQNLQDVPISITAYSGENLDRMNVNNVLELSGLAPGLQVHGGDSSVAPKVYIRGVGSNDFNPTNPSPTAVYVDGVIRGSSIMQLDSFFDLSQVEVLRGPQGTLFGRNTTGGALNITSRRPTDYYTADLTARYGSRERMELEGGVGGPVIEDVLAFRAAANYVRDDGYTKNRLTGNNVNDTDRWAARMSLLYTPNDRVEVLAHIGGGNSRNGALQGQARGLIPNTAEATGADGRCLPSFYGTSACTDALGYVDTDGDPYAGDYSMEGRDRLKLFNADVTTTVDLGELSLVSVTGFVNARHRDDENTDSGPNNLIKGFYRVDQDQFTQEFRLQSNSGGRFDWVAGVFYMNDSLKSDSAFEIGLDLLNMLPDPMDGVAMGVGTVSYPHSLKTESYAVFGEVDYKLTDRLSLVAGLRWSRDDKTMDYHSRFTEAGVTLVDFHGSKSFESISGRAVLNYDIGDNSRAYVSYNRGYKSGGFAGGMITDVQDLGPYDDEVLNAYEVGFKSELFGRRARLNAAAFYYDYQDLQVYSYVVRGPTSVPILDNASDAVIQGAEIELTVAPMKGLDISLGAAVLDSEYKNYISVGEDFSGNRLPTAPKFTFNGAVSYQHSLGDKGDLLMTLSGSYRSKFYFSSGNVERLSQDGYWTVNGELGWALPDGKTEVGLWARNLTDEVYQRGIVNLEALGMDRVSMGEPRSAGVYLRLRY